MGTLNFAGGASLSGSGSNLQSTSGLDFGGSWVDAPAGTVIQTLTTTVTTEVATSSTSYQDFISLTWTPKLTNSHKIITVEPIRLILLGYAGVEGNFRISDGTNVTVRYRLYNGNSETMYMSPILRWYWTQSHTAGTSVTFTAQCRNGSAGNGTVIWGDSGGTARIIIQEIAQ